MMDRKILLATGNRDKAKELKAILRDYEILTLKDIDFDEDIAEDGLTFEENALIKARAAHKACALVCIADDSGLCVDHLDGGPGIYSARFSGGDYHDNNVKLLEVMKDVPYEKRTAQFVCSAAVVFPDGREDVVRAEVRGHILFDFAGEGGFGYDPLFFCDKAGKSYSVMSSEEKNSLSHRKIAFERLRPMIEEYFEGKQ